jgi:hypothetical protein
MTAIKTRLKPNGEVDFAGLYAEKKKPAQVSSLSGKRRTGTSTITIKPIRQWQKIIQASPTIDFQTEIMRNFSCGLCFCAKGRA